MYLKWFHEKCVATSKYREMADQSAIIDAVAVLMETFILLRHADELCIHISIATYIMHLASYVYWSNNTI